MPILRRSIRTARLHPAEGNQAGNWLTREQAKELLAVPDRSTLKGKRDYVILGLLVGCVLRRQELATLDVRRTARKPLPLYGQKSDWPLYARLMLTDRSQLVRTGVAVGNN